MKILKISMVKYNTKLLELDIYVVYCVQTSVFNLSSDEIVPETVNMSNEF